MTDYISKEKALKLLQMQLLDLESVQDKGEYSELCENRGARDAIDEAIYGIRTIKVADVKPINQWINVKDRLPDKFNYVLCYCKTTTGEGNVFMYGAYHNDTWWLKTCRTYATLEQPQMQVLYWMPLPEPPKDDDTNA